MTECIAQSAAHNLQVECWRECFLAFSPKHFSWGTELEFECLLFAAILAFSEITADNSNFGKFALSLYDTGKYMRLDSAAQKALNVMKQRTDANDAFSLYGLMNRGRTAMARRLLKAHSCHWFPNFLPVCASHVEPDLYSSFDWGKPFQGHILSQEVGDACSRRKWHFHLKGFLHAVML